MNTEELLTPRYKVIADYPNCPYKIGDITNGGMITSGDIIYYDNNGPKWGDYPHLFKRLRWYEGLQTKDFPDYVKVKDQDGKWIYIKIDGTVYHNFFNKNYLGLKYKSGGGILCNYVYPSTQSEYEEYINKNLLK